MTKTNMAVIVAIVILLGLIFLVFNTNQQAAQNDTTATGTSSTSKLTSPVPITPSGETTSVASATNTLSVAPATTTDVSKHSFKACGMDFTVSGGMFSPDSCQFEVIAPGPNCGDNTACGPTYTISLKALKPKPGEIIGLALYNFSSMKVGTYTVDAGTQDFKGQAMEMGSKGVTQQILTKGTLAIHSSNSTSVDVSFDAQFANGVTVKGSGLINVMHGNAP